MSDHRQGSLAVTKLPPRVMRYMRHLTCRVVYLMAVMVLVVACASPQRIEHGISVKTRGLPEKVYDIQINYGAKLITFPGAGSGASLWNAPMPIPDSMTVQWTVNRVRKNAIVPLIGKASFANRLVKWNLIFTEDQLQVFRVDDDPSSKYYFKKPVQIYPE